MGVRVACGGSIEKWQIEVVRASYCSDQGPQSRHLSAHTKLYTMDPDKAPMLARKKNQQGKAEAAEQRGQKGGD